MCRVYILHLPVHLSGICWINWRSWWVIWVFTTRGSVLKSYMPSLTQVAKSWRQEKRKGRGSSTRHASCEGEVEQIPISFNTSSLCLRWSYCFNINWGTVCCSRPPLLLCSMRVLCGEGRNQMSTGFIKKNRGICKKSWEVLCYTYLDKVSGYIL